MNELSPAQRREFRAAAHHLNPVVAISGNGLTPAVLAEIENSLQAHELIKIKVHGTERDQRESLMTEVCTTLKASAVQHIGNILVVWRKRREETAKAAPDSAARRGAKPASSAKSARAFAATARRTALIQAAAEKKRIASRGKKRPAGMGGPKRPARKPG